jgi:hypothetical protein
MRMILPSNSNKSVKANRLAPHTKVQTWPMAFRGRMPPSLTRVSFWQCDGARSHDSGYFSRDSRLLISFTRSMRARSTAGTCRRPG